MIVWKGRSWQERVSLIVFLFCAVWAGALILAAATLATIGLVETLF